MKKILSSILVCVFVLLAHFSYAQEDEPRFPGCDDPADVDCADMKMMQFVFSNLKQPEGNPGGEVVASFMVKNSGELADITIVENLTDACDQEVIRILNLMPTWLPAKEDGTAIEMEWELVVKFNTK